MTNTRTRPQSINEYVLEIRYTPNPKVLDYRGTWVEVMRELMGLDKWRITSNRVDVHDEAKSIRAFVSFRNAGLVMRDSPARNSFPGKAGKLLRWLFQEKAFGDQVFVARLGVRARFATSFDGPFEDLLERYATQFLKLTGDAEEIFGGKVIDFGGPINFSTRHGKINTMSGPMKLDQLQQFFESREDLPEAALYVDLDYWQRPQRKLTGREIIKLVKLYAEETWDIHDKLESLILGQ